MKPLLHPSSVFLFFTVAIFISINNIPTSLCEDDGHYTNCNKAFTCGSSSVSNLLKYPFWGGNREMYCGEPGLELTCEDSVSKMTISSVKYRIIEWDNTTQRLTVARDDYWDGICAVSDYKSSSFDNTTFQRDGEILNVTLLYNCAPNANPANLYYFQCGVSRVYYVLGPSYSGLCPSPTIVVIPISGRGSSLVSANRINDALDEGFELTWDGNYDECARCVGSGGACGYDDGGFRCFCKDGPYVTSCNSERAPTSSSTSTSSASTAAGFGVIIFFIMIACRLKRGTWGQKRIFWKRRKSVDHNVEAFMQNYNLSIAKRYSYREVKGITNSFRDKLGQGGYGVVYKARLPDGRHVAVKIINESKGNGEEFINEVASISRTSHMNIVSLLGFCYEMNKRALIYEFMPNGSLDKFIYRSEFPNATCNLDWNTLLQIAIGIARGLEYLHQGCISRILHLDIKPQNILLDEEFCPKISDFGLAKICQKKESIVSILGTRGTIGYIAPEVFSRTYGGVSYKSDVYSYGMLILEMIGGRKNHDIGGSHTTEMYFPDWIYKDLEQGTNLVDCLAITEEENDMVKKITMVSLWCIQMNPSNRPSMSKVIDMLQGPLQSVSYPPKPVLCSLERPPLQISSMSSSNLYEANSTTTQNGGSIKSNEFNKDENER